MPHALASIKPVTELTADATAAAAIRDLCAEHERLARFKSFTEETAWTLGTTIRSLFLERHGEDKSKGIVIKIETFTGHTLFAAAVGKTPVIGPDNWVWASGKSNVVKRFGVSSLRKGREFAAQGRAPAAKNIHEPEYACHGGGFPIWLYNNDTAPIGAIMVSGLPQLADHQLIIDSIVKCEDLLA